MPTTGSMTPAERKAAARKLLQKLANDVEYQRSIAKRLEAMELANDVEYPRSIAKRPEAIDSNSPKDSMKDDLATKVAGLEKAYQRVEKMLSLTNEGRVVQKAIELETQLEKVKEQLANAQDTIRVLQAEITDLKKQGREVSHGYDSDEYDEYDMVYDKFITTPAMRKYLDQRDAKNNTPSGKPPRTPATTRRSARAAAMASARRAKRGSAAAGLAAEGLATSSTPVSKKSRSS